MNAALNDDRLEGNTVRRAELELFVRSVAEDMSDADYLREVLTFVGHPVRDSTRSDLFGPMQEL